MTDGMMSILRFFGCFLAQGDDRAMFKIQISGDNHLIARFDPGDDLHPFIVFDPDFHLTPNRLAVLRHERDFVAARRGHNRPGRNNHRLFFNPATNGNPGEHAWQQFHRISDAKLD